MRLGIYDINDKNIRLTYKQRFDIYKAANFTDVSFFFDNNYLNGEDRLALYDYAKSIGLNVSQVHLDYENANLLWQENEGAETFFSYLKNCLVMCVELKISHVVLHSSKGTNPPSVNELGLKRLKKLNEILHGTNSYLCFENVRVNNSLLFVLKQNLSNIGFCFDSGHANCYGLSDELKGYFNKIYTTHLHDNNGHIDSHSLMGLGNVNWQSVKMFLQKTPRKVDALEVFPSRETNLNKQEFAYFVEKAYKSYNDRF